MHRLCIAGTLDVGLITESTHTAKTWTRKVRKSWTGSNEQYAVQFDRHNQVKFL